MSEIKTAIISGEELRTCRFRRPLPGGGMSDWETHTDLRGAPVGDKVLMWEYHRLVRPRGVSRRVSEHVQVMYCAAGWHATAGTAQAPDGPEVCNTLLTPKWRKRRSGQERFRRFWEFHEEHPVLWVVKTRTPGRDGPFGRLAYCDPELPAEYRPAESAMEQSSDRPQVREQRLRIRAEDKRFELLRGCPQHAFQACALGH